MQTAFTFWLKRVENQDLYLKVLDQSPIPLVGLLSYFFLKFENSIVRAKLFMHTHRHHVFKFTSLCISYFLPIFSHERSKISEEFDYFTRLFPYSLIKERKTRARSYVSCPQLQNYLKFAKIAKTMKINFSGSSTRSNGECRLFGLWNHEKSDADAARLTRHHFRSAASGTGRPKGCSRLQTKSQTKIN